MKGQDEVHSVETAQLKEKIRLKKLDRGSFVREVNRDLAETKKTRNALRIGNECLRYMTMREEETPVRLNAQIFSGHSNTEKLSMQRTNLSESIIVNENRLFKTGKVLLKEDFQRERLKQRLDQKKMLLDRSVQRTELQQTDYQDRCQAYLHKQAMVSDSNHREVVAKLLHQRLQAILTQLRNDICHYPKILRDIREKTDEKTAELKDFSQLKQRGQKFLNLELSQLKPLDNELAKVTQHFCKVIAQERNELEDRRKKSSLAKFITERDATFFNFSDSSNMRDITVKAKSMALQDAYETLISLMDAMMVSDVRYVVDCIMDQKDVTLMLKDEMLRAECENAELTAKYAGIVNNNEYLRFNNTTKDRLRERLSEAKDAFRTEQKKYETLDEASTKLDKLVSALNVSVHALFEKLRQIKIEEEFTVFQGDLVKDIQNFNKKLEKMMTIISNNTIPVGTLRPLMLHMFKNKRLPPDSIRVDLQSEMFGTAIQTYEFYEFDQPGFVSRELLKARSAQAGGASKKRKQGGGGGRGGK